MRINNLTAEEKEKGEIITERRNLQACGAIGMGKQRFRENITEGYLLACESK